MKNDKINHPDHYTHGGIECIDAIEAATTGLEGTEAVCTGNALKYLWRWKFKNGVEDLLKAMWYIQRLIDLLDEQENEDEDEDDAEKCANCPYKDICGSDEDEDDEDNDDEDNDDETEDPEDEDPDNEQGLKIIKIDNEKMPPKLRKAFQDFLKKNGLLD